MSRARPGPPVWVIGAIGLFIGLVVSLEILIPNHMNPSVFLAFGEDSAVHKQYAEDRLGQVVTRPRGHDGKFFFIQANDPWYLDPELHAYLLDRPYYRGQRMLYPLVASGFGLLTPTLVAWGMLLTNILALAIGAVVAAALASRSGWSTWVGLSVPLNIGLLYEIWIGGASVLGYVLCLAAVYVLGDRKEWTAALLFAAAALSRESMMAFVAGVCLLRWMETRTVPWRLLLTPLIAMGVWQAYLRIRLMGVSGFGANWSLLSPPFVGIFEAIEAWVKAPSDLLVNLAIVALVISFVPLALRSRQAVVWGALPFIVLGLVLSVETWRKSFDFTRALAPIFTAAVFLLVERRYESTGREAFSEIGEEA